MFLILDQEVNNFSLRIKYIAELKGLKTFLITSAELAHNLALVYHLSGKNSSLNLYYQNVSINTTDIEGVYCGINVFDPFIWTQFTRRDAEYAARETQALWLAILSSLPCRVVNPPALDSLAGTCLSTPEILHLAHQLGFHIPMVIDIESGKLASEVFKTGVPTLYTDLGKIWPNNIRLCQKDLSFIEKNENHFRVLEEFNGKMVYVTLLGNQFFAFEVTTDSLIIPEIVSKIPRIIKSRLRTLHKKLNLILSEYYFHIMSDDTWIFLGSNQRPIYTFSVLGDSLIEKIVDYCTGNEG